MYLEINEYPRFSYSNSDMIECSVVSIIEDVHGLGNFNRNTNQPVVVCHSLNSPFSITQKYVKH